MVEFSCVGCPLGSKSVAIDIQWYLGLMDQLNHIRAVALSTFDIITNARIITCDGQCTLYPLVVIDLLMFSSMYTKWSWSYHRPLPIYDCVAAVPKPMLVPSRMKVTNDNSSDDWFIKNSVSYHLYCHIWTRLGKSDLTHSTKVIFVNTKNHIL